ncbi:arsenic resistance protein [Spiribacter vilamensis]|uniref:ACR3 family arsenite efflux pump ArsB n=1 Tax=Spiribacter vilamensis TaxID=531306 RepID=A0A4V2GJE9_9GAMM|nr:arsenic resistance protein [Spiribacter vilamensis]RZU99735.1 ACR3 family arsenite efflux pump ArsB [Spiribacter vilamensis]TVO61319.1 arsenic resistance protein [Spiribacter vilamensis]
MRALLERHQSWIYLVFILAGVGVGLLRPDSTAAFDRLLWPLLGVLLYVTFTQVPLTHVREGMRDWRFLSALMVGNFVVIPLGLAVLVAWLPLSPTVMVGVLLVLLAPCTDWFISFTHLGKGDAGRAIAAAPLLLFAQLIMLPVYLWFFLGHDWLEAALSTHLLVAFVALILTPLFFAWLTERFAENQPRMQSLVCGMGALPVPLLAVVVFVIAASQVNEVAGLPDVLWPVLPIFVGYLVVAAVLGRFMGHLFRLDAPGARTLVFSFGTRNSFVVLPIALALPEPWQAAVVVIVFQSLVELFGMVAYLSLVPRWLIAAGSGPVGHVP